ncbi:MAG TPA: AsmA family protein [Burkholderiales bacterium]|nr:AsmA family protein [Burkholderiales bacterium]
MRALKWVGIGVLVLVLGLILFITFGLNLLRGPIERAVTEATGRQLVIGGDLEAAWDWVHPRFRAHDVRFANPGWANGEHMFAAEAVEASISVAPLLTGRVVVPELHLEKPVVALQLMPDGRKNWLLDRDQKDEGGSRVFILRLTLDQGKLRYFEPGRKIDIEAGVASERDGIEFSATGRYKGLPLTVSGRGAQVLALRETETPYPLKGQAKVGETTIDLDGTVTDIVGIDALDAKIRIRGESMVQLYEIFGIAFPETSPYDTTGRLVRAEGVWRYEDFSGKVGKSDLAGTFELRDAEPRPLMKAELKSKLLNFADLGPLVGTTEPSKAGVLPDRQFDTSRWGSVDADVTLKAGRLERPEQLPLDDLAARIRMKDRVLTLEPLEFGVAGGKVAGAIRMDGTQEPIDAAIRLRVRNLKLAQLFPTIEKAKGSLGDVDGLIELEGRGNSVARMLGTSNGKVGLFVDDGRISQFLMELAALDLWDVAKLALKGDEPVGIRCAIADFTVKGGRMEANALVFDTEVVNVTGKGSVNLKTEEMDITLKPEPKDKSIASLNTPLYLRGTFGKPDVGPDAGRLAAKGAGAILMGIINPLLAVIPLLEEGGGKDSNCRKLIAEAAAPKDSAAGGTKKK